MRCFTRLGKSGEMEGWWYIVGLIIMLVGIIALIFIAQKGYAGFGEIFGWLR